MALTEVYVDPSIAGDSGAGTVGDPYGDLEYALEQVTRDATNGDRFNIKAGTDEILEFALDVIVDYGTPTRIAPLFFQGYTSAANDGGEGGISGGGSVAIVDDVNIDYVSFVDMHLHDVGSNFILRLDNGGVLLRCRFDNSTSNMIDVDKYYLSECYFTNGTQDALVPANGAILEYCVFENHSTNKFVSCVDGNITSSRNNIFIIDGSTDGHRFAPAGGEASVIDGNVFWSDGGTGSGLHVDGGQGTSMVSNNIFAGFSGTGGIGLELNSAQAIDLLANNAFYNNATDKVINGVVHLDLGGEQSLGVDPFTDASNGDFSVSTALKALGYPSLFPQISTDNFLDIGAAQREEAGGGGGVAQALAY